MVNIGILGLQGAIEEHEAAIANAANTRYWSTVANGYNVPFDDFKKKWDKMLVFIKKQSEAKK